MLCFSSLSLHRSSGFQDRQRSSLFRRHFHQRSRFKEGMMKYEVERSQSLRREKKGRDKLDELERREAFLQGKKDHLLAEIRAPFEALFASPPSGVVYSVFKFSFCLQTFSKLSPNFFFNTPPYS